MRESVDWKELNKRCQKPNYKTVGNWYVRHVLRDAALPLTRLLLKTSVSANQVTLFSILVGIAGIVFIARLGSLNFLWGILLLQFWYYLDHVDGQIARFHNTSSLSGRFFDFWMHHLIHAPIFFALGWYLFSKTGAAGWVIVGFVVAMAMMMFNICSDIQCKTFFEKISKEPALQKRERVSHAPGLESTEKSKSLVRRVFSCLHKSCEIHVLLIVLSVAVLIELFFFPRGELRQLLFIYYAFAVLLIAILRPSYWVLTKRIDKEYSEWFI